MRFEDTRVQKEQIKSEALKLAREFCSLAHTTPESVAVFEHLEEDLIDAGFMLAEKPVVAEILYNPSLRTRSELFTHAVDLILEEIPITLQSKQGDANMCIMASSQGFSTAMQEGFSGKDVEGMVKVVISFAPTHLRTEHTIPLTHDLWRTKPDTAQVSRSGEGTIQPEDVQLISFRFPIGHFPERLLTKEEQERLEDARISFVVRHYARAK